MTFIDAPHPARTVTNRFLVITILFGIFAIPISGQVINGDFESAKDPLEGWDIEQNDKAVTVEKVAGFWRTCNVKFNSGPYSKARMYIAAWGNPSGRFWVDNLRPQGFKIENPSFEKLTPDGRGFAGWSIDQPGVLVHASTERTADGKYSAMLADRNMAAAGIKMWQEVDVQPNTDYSYTFDFYMENDFYGAIRCSVYDLDSQQLYMGGIPDEEDIDQLIAERAIVGLQYARIAPNGGTASLSQVVQVEQGSHVEVSANIKLQELEGKAALQVLDAESGKVLREIAIVPDANNREPWRRVQYRLVSPVEKLHVRIIAEGQGAAFIDAIQLSSPDLLPTPQNIEWLPASDDFRMSSKLTYAVNGAHGDTLKTGLEMLSKDLAALQCQLEETAEESPGLRIRIDPKLSDQFQDKGEEAYLLTANAQGIDIAAPHERGAFYGVMTLLQLMGKDDGEHPIVMGCQIRDWPDFPWRALNRGLDSMTPEFMARRKFNVALHINLHEVPEWRRHGIMPIYHDNITHYPYHQPPSDWPGILKDPNIAEGVEGMDDLTLVGEKSAELSGRNILRTKLTDIVVTSMDGKTTFVADQDYRVLSGGELSVPFKDDVKPFAIARIGGGRISDGQKVRVRYEHVRPHTGRFPVLCLAEPEPQEAVAERAKQWVQDYNFPVIGMHVSEEPEVIGKGPRCRATGLTASQLVARYFEKLDRAIKQADPKARMIIYADDFMPWQNADRSGLGDAAAILPKDAILNVWEYNVSDNVAINVKSCRLWSGLGHEFILMGWYDHRNIHTSAATALWARQKGMGCLGLSNWAYPPAMDMSVTEPDPSIDEVARCAWRVPRQGEPNYIDVEAELKASAR